MKTILALLVGLMAVFVVYTVAENFRVIKITQFSPPNPKKAVPERAVIKILVRDRYFAPSLYERLRIEKGIRVEETRYNTDEECLQHLSAGEKYDLALVPDYLARRLDRLDRTWDIDYTKIPNHQNIAAGARRSEKLTPLFRCSVPYIFGTIGLGFNAKFIGRLPLKWAALLSPLTPQLLRGRIGLLNEPRQTLGIALLALGKDPNTTNPVEIHAAGELVRRCLNNLTRIGTREPGEGASYTLAEELSGDHLYLATAWGADIARAMDTNPSLRFISPDEGALLFFDCFVVMRDTNHRAIDEEFIDYLLRPEISAEVTNRSYYATVNEAATPYVSRILFNGPAYYIPHGKQLFFRDDVGDAEAIYLAEWRDVRAYYATNIKPTLDHELGFGGEFVAGNDEAYAAAPKVPLTRQEIHTARDKINLDTTAPLPAK